MYGLVNKAAQDFIIQDHGMQTWLTIKKKAGVEEDAFISMEPYPDEITYNIVGAASEILKVDSGDILENFGRYWIEFTMEDGYAHLLDLAGKTFSDFLRNLNNMHAHIAQNLSQLRPPSFLCVDIDESTFLLEYHSDRAGLRRFVEGLLLGLGDRFNLEVEVQHLGSIPGSENSHEFKIQWSQS